MRLMGAEWKACDLRELSMQRGAFLTAVKVGSYRVGPRNRRSRASHVTMKKGGNAEVAAFLRDKEGMFAVDKPQGMTSHDVVHRVRKTVANFARQSDVRVRKLLDVKCGHGGTLDPLATGVLVVALGTACKRTGIFLKGSKRYIAVGKLGSETDTCDSEGQVTVERPSDHVDRQVLENALTSFVGDIMQAPPAYSALKVKGKAGYELARSGQAVQFEPRPVVVHDIRIVSFDDGEFELDVYCGSGTYIRSLIQDIARSVDSAAHMVALRRTAQGPFSADDALSIDEADDAQIIFGSIADQRPKVDAYVEKVVHPD